MSGGIKKGKDIKLSGWKTLVEVFQHPRIKPEGYSTAEEIAQNLKISSTLIRFKLKALRENNEIKCLQMRNEKNQIIWVYKD